MRRLLITVVVGVILLATIGFQAWDRRPPHTYSGPGEIRPYAVRRGMPVTLSLSVIRYRDCPGTLIRWLVFSDGTAHLYDGVIRAATGTQVSYNRKTQSRSWPREAMIHREFLIPRNEDRVGGVSAGSTIYHAEIEYYCNIVQQALRWPIRIRPPTITFEIID